MNNQLKVATNSTTNIVEILRADPKDLTYDQAESVLAVLKLKCNSIADRLYEEEGREKYRRIAA